MGANKVAVLLVLAQELAQLPYLCVWHLHTFQGVQSKFELRLAQGLIFHVKVALLLLLLPPLPGPALLLLPPPHLHPPHLLHPAAAAAATPFSPVVSPHLQLAVLSPSAAQTGPGRPRLPRSPLNNNNHEAAAAVPSQNYLQITLSF